MEYWENTIRSSNPVFHYSNIDEFAKNRHSPAGANQGCMKCIEKTGFPFLREWRKSQGKDFLRDHQNSMVPFL
jgi:hypothetical protein